MDSLSVSYTAGFEMGRKAETLFPLFSPEGERLWVPGWEYEDIMGTTTLHEDYVFLTKTHDHAAIDAVWIVKHCDPETFNVQYYKIEPGEKVGIVTVVCTPLDDSSTRVDVTYTYMGLSERGNRFIEHYTKENHEDFIKEWKALLEAYFKKGPH